MAVRELTPNEALCYLDDIAHGRKMEYDPHVLKKIVEKHLGDGKYAIDILRIIYNSPFIVERLFEMGKLGEDARHRYMWGTISAEDAKKIREFFADGKRD